MSAGSSEPATARSAACWWSTGVDGIHAPTIAQTCGAHIPAAFTTISASMGPSVVRMRRTSRRSVSSMPVTRTPVRILTPAARAAPATAWVAVCGSRWPSPGSQTAPRRSSGARAGISRRASAGPTKSASSPFARVRLSVRWSSRSWSGLDATRRLPTASNAPMERYSSMLYWRNAIIVDDGLNAVTTPIAWQVEPAVSWAFSTRRTSCSPARARWYATLHPVIPPPMTTIRAWSTLLLD